MYRLISIFVAILFVSVPMQAQDSVPVIEVKADRVMIYPQRMELTGEDG